MKSLGTKVCFDYVWKPGDSRGWDRGWDCLPSTVSLRHITLFCPRTNPPMVRAATLVPGCLPHPGVRIAADGGGHSPELVLLGGTQFVSDGSCPRTLTAATQADFWQRSCFRWWHGDLTDTTPGALHWRQASVCLKHQACICFLLHEVCHKVWDWTCIWQVRWVSWNTMPPPLHTVRSSSVAFGIWKYRRAEPVSWLTKACNLAQVTVHW